MADDNEQRMAHERIINNKFADIVKSYGERPLIDEPFEVEILPNHPSRVSWEINDFVKEALESLGDPLGEPEDYYECYHDPSRWRCKAHRAPKHR